MRQQQLVFPTEYRSPFVWKGHAENNDDAIRHGDYFRSSVTAKRLQTFGKREKMFDDRSRVMVDLRVYMLRHFHVANNLLDGLKPLAWIRAWS
jgi:hypothetical protein